MMEGLDDGPDLLAGDRGDNKGRSDTVDLSTDTSLLVDISDALSERDKVLSCCTALLTFAYFGIYS